MSDDDVPLLHLIAQTAWHDPAFIVGNREGLKRLRKAIDTALLRPGAWTRADECAADGEGYGVHVRCVTTAEMETAPYGYTDPVACGDAPWPPWMKRAR